MLVFLDSCSVVMVLGAIMVAIDGAFMRLRWIWLLRDLTAWIWVGYMPCESFLGLRWRMMTVLGWTVMIMWFMTAWLDMMI